jgi:homoserine kinase
MTSRHRLVRVPASSANLGPGYDVMAAAGSL